MLDRSLFVSTADALRNAHGARLRALIGHPIEATWVAWDEAGETWFPDEAVILRIGSTNLEIVCWKLDEIALTWSQVDLVHTPAWAGQWDGGFQLSWRRDAVPALVGAVGRTITDISIVESLFQTTVRHSLEHPEDVGRHQEVWLLNGIEFELGDHRLQIFNALDENGITDDPPTGPDFRRTAV